jgi:hypothetical protein
MMTVEQHDAILRDIEALFRGRLEKDRAGAVVDHVKDCDRCERVYQRYADAEGALFRDKKSELNLFAKNRVAARLFDTAPKPRPRFVPKLVAGMTAAAAFALMAIVFVPQSQYTARGNDEALAPETTLRVLAVTKDLQVVDLAGGDVKITQGDRLKLLYDSGARHRFGTVAIVHESGRVLADITAKNIDADVVDRPFGAMIPVDNWPKGQVAFIMRLSIEPQPSVTDFGATAKDEPGDAIRVLKVRVD